jgi:hypothetical protein
MTETYYISCWYQETLAKPSYSSFIFARTKKELEHALEMAGSGTLPETFQKIWDVGVWMTGTCTAEMAKLFCSSVDCDVAYSFADCMVTPIFGI